MSGHIMRKPNMLKRVGNRNLLQTIVVHTVLQSPLPIAIMDTIVKRVIKTPTSYELEKL